MRGFVIGSLALIVTYVILQPGSTEKLVAGNNVLMTMFRRGLSGDVPAIGAVKTGGTVTTASTTTVSTAGGVIEGTNIPGTGVLV